jgi:hypothetical protein
MANTEFVSIRVIEKMLSFAHGNVLSIRIFCLRTDSMWLTMASLIHLYKRDELYLNVCRRQYAFSYAISSESLFHVVRRLATIRILTDQISAVFDERFRRS